MAETTFQQIIDEANAANEIAQRKGNEVVVAQLGAVEEALQILDDPALEASVEKLFQLVTRMTDPRVGQVISLKATFEQTKNYFTDERSRIVALDKQLKAEDAAKASAKTKSKE